MLPAAAFTAYATATDRARALLAGFQAHLPKPVEPSELAAVVARARRTNGRQILTASGFHRRIRVDVSRPISNV